MRSLPTACRRRVEPLDGANPPDIHIQVAEISRNDPTQPMPRAADARRTATFNRPTIISPQDRDRRSGPTCPRAPPRPDGPLHVTAERALSGPHTPHPPHLVLHWTHARSRPVYRSASRADRGPGTQPRPPPRDAPRRGLFGSPPGGRRFLSDPPPSVHELRNGRVRGAPRGP